MTAPPPHPGDAAGGGGGFWPLRRASLRVRLTVWIALVTLLIECVLALVIVLYVRSDVRQMVDQRLVSISQAVEQSIQRVGGDPASADFAGLASSERDARGAERIVIALFDPEGGLLGASEVGEISAEDAGVRDALASDIGVFRDVSPRWFAEPDDRSRRARVLSRKIGGEGSLVLAVAADDAYLRRVQGVLGRTVLVVLPLSLLSTVVASYLIAGAATRPFKVLSERARTWTAETLSEEDEYAQDAPEEVEAIQEELSKAKRRLSAAFQSQYRFMANVSHELKTPIAVLLTQSELIGGRASPDEVRQFARSLREEMTRLGRMVDSFLLLARVEQPDHLDSGTPCLVNEMVMEAVEECASFASQYEVRIDVSLIDDERYIDAATLGDPELLRVLIGNLLRNAIRFSPAGESVVVRARVAEVDAALLGRDERTAEASQITAAEVSVIDAGPGIPEEIIGRVFDRFAQATGEERRGRGHGLGLAIAQGIAELHGGQIHAANNEGAGALFRVYLPILPARAG